MKLAVIVAMDRARGIGKDGDLPWRLPGEMAYFRRLTREAPEGERNAVIMGRKTFESIPAKFRPLPGRLNLVLSRAPDYLPDGAARVANLEEALHLVGERPDIHRVFVIGGSSVYAAALAHPACDTLYITQVDATMPCDTFFPPFEGPFERVERSEVHREGGLCYTFDVHRRRSA